jgi:hypothetical protein
MSYDGEGRIYHEENILPAAWQGSEQDIDHIADFHSNKKKLILNRSNLNHTRRQSPPLDCPASIWIMKSLPFECRKPNRTFQGLTAGLRWAGSDAAFGIKIWNSFDSRSEAKERKRRLESMVERSACCAEVILPEAIDLAHPLSRISILGVGSFLCEALSKPQIVGRATTITNSCIVLR